MIPCSQFIRIFLVLVLLVCAGCGRSLSAFGTESKTGFQPPDAVHKTPVPPSAPPARDERKPVCYDAGVGHDKSYGTSILTEDVTWSGRILVKGALTIAAQATLNIRPGTEIQFVPDPNGLAEGTLLVKGRIAAQGAVDKPILFKAATAGVVPDSWRGIIVLGSEKNNLFEYCRLEGARVGLDVLFSTVSLRNTVFYSCTTAARLQNSLFQAWGGTVSGADVGYALIDSEADVRDVSFANNVLGVYASHGALNLKGGSFSGNSGRALDAVDSKLTITDAVFTKNGTGLALTGSEGSLEASRIVENREYGVQLIRSRVKIFGNLIFMNTGVGIQSDTGGSAAWDNNISLNGLYDFYNAGSDDFRAIGNWWGGGAANGRKKRIFDKTDDPDRGAVLTSPELLVRPAPNP